MEIATQTDGTFEIVEDSEYIFYSNTLKIRESAVIFYCYGYREPQTGTMTQYNRVNEDHLNSIIDQLKMAGDF